MPSPSLSELEAALRASWSPDTAYASVEYLARGAEHPSRGQCGTTALVIQHLLGGELMVADVQHEGRVDGVRYWNLLPSGCELDLTSDQFAETESLVNARRVIGARNPANAGEGPYQLLRSRVAALLAHGGGTKKP
jgi:hypothetical protein